MAAAPSAMASAVVRAAPFPDAATSAGVRWTRIPGGGGFAVWPAGADKGAAPVVVPEELLRSTLAESRLDGARRMAQLAGWPATVRRERDRALAAAFPAAADSVTSAASFPETLVGESRDRPHALIEQDPLAPPYVRVTVATGGGVPEGAFSIARAAAEAILADRSRPAAAQKVLALRGHPAKLPEAARAGFAELTPGRLRELAGAQPAVAAMPAVNRAAEQDAAERRAAEMVAAEVAAEAVARSQPDEEGAGADTGRRNGTGRAGRIGVADEVDPAPAPESPRGPRRTIMGLAVGAVFVLLVLTLVVGRRGRHL